MKRAIIGLLTGLAITVATLCAMEGFASALLFVRDYRHPSAARVVIRPHVEHDTLLGWSNRPSFSSPNEYGAGVALTTTSLGFRSTGASDSAAASARQGLICSGDAYTLGYGVSDEHTWCALLAKSLASPGLRTYNMGEIDFGLDQSALWYERDGHRVPHQIEVLGVTDAALERMPTSSHDGRFKPMLTVSLGKLELHGVPVPQQTASALQEAARERAKYNLRVVQAYMQFTGKDPRARASHRIDARWSLVVAVLDSLAATNTANGSRLVLAYLPMKREVRSKATEQRREKLASYAQRRGITYIDLLPPLRAMRPDSLDLAFISHVPSGAAPGALNFYSDLGNAWVAREISAALFPSTSTSSVATRAR